jgi:hypothetical protein
MMELTNGNYQTGKLTSSTVVAKMHHPLNTEKGMSENLFVVTLQGELR